MSEYLSKEEIKQWRSSLEKITLEEFAARLGKKIEEAKPTNDLVDIVLKGKPVISEPESWKPAKAEKISSIAERAFERERDIAPSPFSISNIKFDITEDSKPKVEKPAVKKAEKAVKNPEVEKALKAVKAAKTTTKKSTKTKSSASTKSTKTRASKKTASSNTLREEVRVVFKKALTDREQKVFDYFVENNNKIVYAKDLATLLELPRDYVYKYIKNLRAKIEGEKLTNADKGGFILHV